MNQELHTESELSRAFVKFLSEQGFLPISADNVSWNKFPIIHQSIPPLPAELESTRAQLKSALNTHNGIYCYLNSRDELLYVGKGAPLWSRIYSHYLEAFRAVSGDRKGVWHSFFSSHYGGLTILWRSVQGERQRRIIEEMIECVESSVFDKEFPRGKRTTS